jgi:hypothetical protein
LAVAVEALFDPRPQQSWFHVAYAESNVGEHECAIDQKATDDQDKQRKHHFAYGSHAIVLFPRQ